MTNYVFAYHGGEKAETPEAGAEMMEKWNAWVEGLGVANVDPGNPLGMSKTVSANGVTDDGGPNPLGGFSIVKADTIEGAIELARGCPFLDMNGATIEVAEILKM
jgi:hypothetical protein